MAKEPDAKKTKDQKVIENWIKERDGEPAKVKGTEDYLRVRFDPMNENLEKITWAEFFEAFESKSLTFLYDDDSDSRFHKFIK